MKKAKRFLALFLVLCMMVSYPKEIALKLLRLAQSFKAFPLNTVSSFLGVPVRNSPRMGRNLVEGCD